MMRPLRDSCHRLWECRTRTFVVGVSRASLCCAHLPWITWVACQRTLLNPARFYGYTNKGSIEVGKDADFVVISDDYKAIATYANGRKVYDQSEGKIFNPHFFD